MRQDIKKQIEVRLKRIEGQVRGLQKMIDVETYCIDVITQTSAVRKALSAVEDLLLENHLSTHVVEQMKSGNVKKATDEIISIYKLSKKK
ncbi:metal-sensitive transcriptional regulator [Patescibacteria group bacterium]|nr:MAG: metal-sensitive transcriptional regulator [Patescibacteria group bacterium]